MLRVAILASGTGSNAEAILKAIEAKTLNAQVQCIVSNNTDAPVLDLGPRFGVPSYGISHQGLSREMHEEKVLACLAQYDIDYMVLAGYMRLLTPRFLNAFRAENHYRIINIHPALLPAFPGARAYEDAFAYGVKVSGITVHLVDEAMDNGPILLQKPFSRLAEDTFEDFRNRGLAVEHRLYPQALQLLGQGFFHFHADNKTGRMLCEVKNPCFL